MLFYRKAVVTAHIKQNTNAATLEKKCSSVGIVIYGSTLMR